jgi:RNA polymerase sigma factor (sigma-70 family)
MAIGSRSVMGDLRQLGTLFDVGAVAGMTDRQLLDRFVTGSGDASEAAFAALVSRHGPMVLRVCRRALSDPNDVDDAFQATFLVLVRKAQSVHAGDSLGRWLYGVSRKVAGRARSMALKRPFPAGDVSESWEDRARPVSELGSILDEELDRLPRRAREAVRLCHFEGLALKDAADRLDCPVGTVGSRLSRAKGLLRSRLIRRGFAPSALAMGFHFESGQYRAAVPELLAQSTSKMAAKSAAGTIPATVAVLASQGIRSIFMSKGFVTAATAALIGLGCLGTAAAVFGRGAPQAPAKADDAPKPKAEKPSIADQYNEIVKQFEAEQQKVAEAVEKVKTEAESMKIYAKLTPDDVAYSRRMVELAATSPKDPASRDALVWVLNKMYRDDEGPYGDEVARAVRMLVNDHANDPEAVRVGLMLNNVFSRNRDALMEGMYANAETREAKGLARMALAQYLERKIPFVNSAHKLKTRQSYKYDSYDDDGKPIKKTMTSSNEDEGYRAGLRLLDPEALKSEAERLYNEVIDEYGDIPYITTQFRGLEKLLKEPDPKWNNKPLTADELQKLKNMVAKTRSLAQVAEGHLDEMHNLTEGKPAPEIDGKDIDGKPLKLVDYRGKVIVLVFWGSWCGPCMREVPHERELVEKYKGKPFTLLGVNCRETAESARKTMEAEKMTWPQWYDGEDDGGPIVERYHVRAYPTVFVIDAKGIIRAKNALGEGLDQLVERLVKEAENGDGNRRTERGAAGK